MVRHAGGFEECMVFVFDFDGVLAVPLEEGMVAPRARGLKALKEATGMGAVYVLTGRRVNEKSIITSLLSGAGIGLSGVSIITRSTGDSRREVDYKISAMEDIYGIEGCIGELHDDNPYVLASARRRVIRGGVLHYDDICEPLYGYSVLEACRSF